MEIFVLFGLMFWLWMMDHNANATPNQQTKSGRKRGKKRRDDDAYEHEFEYYEGEA